MVRGARLRFCVTDFDSHVVQPFRQPPSEAKHDHLSASQRFFDGLLGITIATLQFVLRHRRSTMFVSFLVIVVTVYLFGVIPKGFFPRPDTSQAFAVTEGSQDISFEAMERASTGLDENRHEDTQCHVICLPSAPAADVSGNSAVFSWHLKPRSQRRHVDQGHQELRKNSWPFRHQRFSQKSPLIRTGGFLSKSLYQFTLQGPDCRALSLGADHQRSHDRPERLSVRHHGSSDHQSAVLVNIDRDKAMPWRDGRSNRKRALRCLRPAGRSPPFMRR